jgi:hypothetical protein
MGIIMKQIPVTIWGSPYGNGLSPYGNGDRHIPCASPFPYGDPRYHMGIIMKHIPVTIWGSPYGNGDRQISCASPFPYGDPRYHMEMISHCSPLPYGDPRMVMGTRYHTGTVQSLTHYHMGTVSIWESWKKSPNGNNYHMGIPVWKRGSREKITIWGLPVWKFYCIQFGDQHLQVGVSSLSVPHHVNTKEFNKT